MKTIKSLQILFRCSTYRSISIYASCITYYLLLSIVPVSIFLISLLAGQGITATPAFHVIAEVFPDIVTDLLEQAADHAADRSNIPIFAISMFAWIWSASKGVTATMDGMDAALRITHRQSYFHKRLLAIVHLLFLSVGINLALLIIVFGTIILETLRLWLPIVPDILLAVFHYRSVLSFLLLTMLFSTVYKLHPSSDIPLRYCFLGGAMVSAGFSLISYGFSIYVNIFADKYQLFGEVGTILLFAIWLRIFVILFLVCMKYSHLRASGHRSVVLYVVKLFHSVYE